MEFKLFDFNLYEETKHDSDSENDGEHTPFIIQMFGLNEEGKSCSIFVENFKPFFYIKVGEDWTEKTKQGFIELIKHKIGPYFAKTIVETKFVQKKKRPHNFRCEVWPLGLRQPWEGNLNIFSLKY